MHLVGKTFYILEVEYNDPHKFAAKLRGFSFTVRTNTVGRLWESNIDYHKWPTVLVDEVNENRAISR